jgi:citrate lyase subunit beta/citryl-CoA lyase
LRGKATGFFGRSVIHPNQIEIVNEIFTPTKDEVDQATELLNVYEQMQASGNSVMALPNGEMIDPANIHYAKFQVNLYNSLNK